MRENIEKFVINFADIPYDRVSIERVLTGFKDLDYFNKGIEVGVTAQQGPNLTHLTFLRLIIYISSSG